MTMNIKIPDNILSMHGTVNVVTCSNTASGNYVYSLRNTGENPIFINSLYVDVVCTTITTAQQLKLQTKAFRNWTTNDTGAVVVPLSNTDNASYRTGMRQSDAIITISGGGSLSAGSKLFDNNDFASYAKWFSSAGSERYTIVDAKDPMKPTYDQDSGFALIVNDAIPSTASFTLNITISFGCYPNENILPDGL